MAKGDGQRYRSHGAPPTEKARLGTGPATILPANRRSVFRASTSAEIGNVFPWRKNYRPFTAAGLGQKPVDLLDVGPAPAYAA